MRQICVHRSHQPQINTGPSPSRPICRSRFFWFASHILLAPFAPVERSHCPSIAVYRSKSLYQHLEWLCKHPRPRLNIITPYSSTKNSSVITKSKFEAIFYTYYVCFGQQNGIGMAGSLIRNAKLINIKHLGRVFSVAQFLFRPVAKCTNCRPIVFIMACAT